MFIELYQLIQKANLKNISLTIQDEGNGKVAVTVMTQNNVGDAVDASLRAALTQPLKLVASPQLLDEGFISHLSSFSESYVETAMSANTEAVTNNMKTSQPKIEKSDPIAEAVGAEDTQVSQDTTGLADIDLDDE